MKPDKNKKQINTTLIILLYSSKCACRACASRGLFFLSLCRSRHQTDLLRGPVARPGVRPETRTLNEIFCYLFYCTDTHTAMPTTVEIPTLQELNVDEVSSSGRYCGLNEKERKTNHAKG